MALKPHIALIRRMERDARSDATIEIIVDRIGVSFPAGSLVYRDHCHSSGDIVSCSRAHAAAMLRDFLAS